MSEHGPNAPAGHNGQLQRYRAELAPGTALREGLDRVVHGGTGALVVLGENAALRGLCTGGFSIDAPLTATNLRELAKLDGAIICSDDHQMIHGAGIHLMPDPSLPAVETGTRHRTAERVAQQTHLPVVAVSASMGTISLYVEGRRVPVEPPAAVMVRANQAMQTLQRYQERLGQVLDRLSMLEIQDQVSVRDVIVVIQRWERVRRLEEETAGYVDELGSDGRLLEMQLLEITVDTASLPTQLENDYLPEGHSLTDLAALSDADLVDTMHIARTLGMPDALETRVRPFGYRQLANVPRLPANVALRLVEEFGDLQGLLGATHADLLAVDGIGSGRAKNIRDTLSRAAELALSE